MDMNLAEKLNIRKFKNILIFDKPEYVNAFDGLTYDISGGKGPYDFIFSFVFSHGEMSESIIEVHEKKLVLLKGLLYMAFPVKSFSFEIEKNSFYKETAFKAIDFLRMDNEFSVVGFVNDL